MNGVRQVWLVALREMRERGRSRGFQAGLVIMLIVVVAMIVMPTMLDKGGGTRDVGVTGVVPSELAAAIRGQGDAIGTTVRVRHYDDWAAGQAAVRGENVDVLVVDARRLEWRDRTDERLQAIVTGAIQLVAVQDRAVAAGIDPQDLLALIAPVPVENVEIGLAEGRSPDDGTTAILISALLLMAIFLYGNLVLTGVVEEKSTRVVEVLLARVPARNLLIGKVAGIGLLGFAQFVVTALAALAAVLVIDSVDMPALSGGVLAWVVVWFVLGYALYAVAYGALGSLASRTEDAQSVAGPVGYVLVACYWAAFLAVSEEPDSGWSRLASLFPGTAPFAMPGRIALGSNAWWEPPVAVVLTLAAIAGLVAFGGRVYTNAILHTGPTLHLRDAWRSNRPRPSITGEPGSEPRTPSGTEVKPPPDQESATAQPHRVRQASANRGRSDSPSAGQPSDARKPPAGTSRR
jgi:ABC-2 type transport system permease protein